MDIKAYEELIEQEDYDDEQLNEVIEHMRNS